MAIKYFFTSWLYIFALIALTICVIYRQKLELFTKTLMEALEENIVPKKLLIPVLSQNQLAEYNGIEKKELYLALMGSVFDVSKGRKYYEEGADYNYFIGKDGSRAFVTGNFKDESNGKDHVLDLPCNSIMSLLDWNNTYTTKYKYIGNLNGRYYDKYGRETTYMKKLQDKIQDCENEKQEEKKHNTEFPPCNIAWQAYEGYKVWCTTSSGGISRHWVGVPRLLFKPGGKEGNCVCMNPDLKYKPNVMFKNYENCPPKDSTCYLGDTNPSTFVTDKHL